MGIEGISFPISSGPYTRALLGACGDTLWKLKWSGPAFDVGDVATWVHHATDGDPYRMEGDGKPCWLVVNDQQSRINDDAAALDSIGNRLGQHWSGDAADGYIGYVAAMRKYLDNHVQQVAQAQDTLHAVYYVLTGFKKDLYNLASATFDACSDVDNSKDGPGYSIAFGVLAVAGLAVGGVGAAAAGLTESFAVAVLGNVVSAAAGEATSYGVDKMRQVGSKNDRQARRQPADTGGRRDADRPAERRSGAEAGDDRHRDVRSTRVLQPGRPGRRAGKGGQGGRRREVRERRTAPRIGLGLPVPTVIQPSASTTDIPGRLGEPGH